MLEEGLIITLMGMGTVFSFLVILIFAMVITYKVLTVINKIFPEVVETTTPIKKTNAGSDEEIAIALVATKVL